MKNSKIWIFLLTPCVGQLAALAQDTITTSTTRTVTSTSWYTQPWIWIVGGVLLLVVVIALMRGSTTRVTTEKTTVIKDSGS